MLDYMDYVVRCYDRSNKWDRSNLYGSIIATPRSILDFSIPQGLAVSVSKKSSARSANSFQLSNYGLINGSLSYFYSSKELNSVLGSSVLSLQEATNTYQFVDSVGSTASNNNSEKNISGNDNLLFYGKLNFPSNILEALAIKSFSSNSRILVKSLSTRSNLIKNHGIITMYYQKNYPTYSWELIYSSNENLVGFRHLYNIRSGNDNKVFYDNSKFSLGSEIWWGINNLTPGISNSLRYSTYSTYIGNPLTITVSCNPLIGLLSATYTVKTSLNSTFCSKYDFNAYSYISNFSLGFEFWKSSAPLTEQVDKILKKSKEERLSDDFLKLMKSKKITDDASIAKITKDFQEKNETKNNPQKLSNIELFKDLYKKIPFTSVARISTSVNERNLKLLWEGKFNDFLIEVGCNVVPFSAAEQPASTNKITDSQESLMTGSATKFGVSIQYSS